MSDQELTAQQRAARAAEAAAAARRAAARHAAARRAQQDAQRRTVPDRRPPALATKPGLAYRGRPGTAVAPSPRGAAAPVQPARETTDDSPPSDVSLPTGHARTGGTVRPPRRRTAAAPIRTAPVPDDRSGVIELPRPSTPRADAGPPQTASPAQAATPEQPVQQEPVELEPVRPHTHEAAPAEPETGDGQPAAPAGSAVDPAHSELRPVAEGPADVAPAEAGVPAGDDAPGQATGRVGAVTGQPTDLPPLPQPPAAVVRTVDPVQAEGPADGLRLPEPPRSADGGGGSQQSPPGEAAAVGRPAAAGLATRTIDVDLPVPDGSPTGGSGDDGVGRDAGATHPPPGLSDGLRLPEPPARPAAPATGSRAATQQTADLSALARAGTTAEVDAAPVDAAPVDDAPTAVVTAPGEDRSGAAPTAGADVVTPSARPWLRAYPPGVPETYRYPLVPITRFVDDAAQDFPDTPAVRFLGADTTYRQLSEQVDRLAAALRDMGLGARDRLAVALPWCPQLVVVLHAGWRIGLDVVVLDADGPAESLADDIHVTAPAALVLLDSAYPGLVVHRDRLGSLQHVMVTGLLDTLPALRARVQSVRLKLVQPDIPQDQGVMALRSVVEAAAPTATQVDLDVEQAPALTTVVDGTPATATHHQVLAAAFQARLWLPDVRAGKESIAVDGSPADPFVLGAGVVTAMLAAATIVLPEPRSGGTARTIDDARPTLLVAPVEAVRRVLAPAARRRDLTSIRVTLAGGHPHDPAVRRTMEQRTGGRLRTCLTAPGLVGMAMAEPVYADPRQSSATLPITDTVVRMVRPDVGGIGELEVSGPQTGGRWVPLGLVGTVDDQGFAEVVGSTDRVITHADGVTDPEVLGAALRRSPAVADAVVRTEFVDDRLRLVVDVTTTDVGLTPDRLVRLAREEAPTQGLPAEWRVTVVTPPTEAAADPTTGPGGDPATGPGGDPGAPPADPVADDTTELAAPAPAAEEEGTP